MTPSVVTLAYLAPIIGLSAAAFLIAQHGFKASLLTGAQGEGE